MATGGGSKEIKGLLKNAREAIRNKEYKEALKNCKGVLKLDKGNYNALVFIGVAAAELGQPDQSIKAYKKAIESDSQQLLAWQGLSGFFEKSEKEEHKIELAETYKKMLDLLVNKDKKKWSETAEKLVNVFQTLGNTEEAMAYLNSLIDMTSKEKGNALPYLKQVVAILSVQKTLTADNMTQLQQAYPAILSSTDLRQEDQLKYYTGYIKCLQKSDANNSCVIEECQKMHELLPSEVWPLQTLAKIHLQCQPDALDDSAWIVYDKLHALQKDSGLALLGLGQRQLKDKRYLEARKLLLQGIKSEKTNIHGWLYLAKSQACLHDNQAAEMSCKEGVKQLKANKSLPAEITVHLKRALSLCQADVLLDSGITSNVQTAIQIYEQFTGSSDDVSLLCKLVQAYIILEDLNKAQQLCDKVEAMSSADSSDITAIQGLLHMAKQSLSQAEQKLLQATETEGDIGLYHFWLGRLYWEMEVEIQSNKTKCLGSLLKAAKLDPYYSNTFLYLGHYYWKVNKDKVKGKKCYQKAYELSPRNEAAGESLGNAYLQLGEEEAAKELYLTVTGESAAGTAKWAWLRLGLCYQKLGEATNAIASFQAALRADPKDRHCWECLGEAYLARGSLTAALKAFTRGTELDPSAIYCLFQIAAIKHNLGAFSEAVTDYQVILDTSPDYVPALKGQGEAYVCLAKASLHKFFTGRAVDYVQRAITVLARVARLKPDLACVWKLLGDACTLLHPLDKELVKLTVPISIMKPLHQGDEEQDQCKGELQVLGARCYGRAVCIQSDCASLWHDLALNYYHQARSGLEEKTQHIVKALQCVKKAISLDSTNHIHWTALGVVAVEADQHKLAQHAFIKSIQIEPQNVVAWTNLGTLYLSHGNVELAHQAFKTSQSLDPAYVQCWIGQALIAEAIGSEETMDLFRHTTELLTHMESSIGYAHWVCQTLLDTKLDKKSDLYRFNIVQMNALPAAMDAIGKYADCAPVDPCAHTMLGLLLERQGLHRAAEKAYGRALNLLQDSGRKDEKNLALANHARSLCLCGHYEEAARTYQAISSLVDFNDIIGLAIALYKMADYPASYQAYEQALQLASSNEDRSQVLSAMGMVAYRSDDTDRAKTLLFKSCQLSSPSVHGLFALCALGLMASDGDVTLATAAITELHKWQDKEEGEDVAVDVAFLSAMIYALQGNNQLACRQAAKLLKRYPHDREMWALVAELMLQLSPNHVEEAVICSKTAIQNNISCKNIPLVHALAEVAVGKHSTTNINHSCLQSAQKAVHLYPDGIGNWAVLAASAFSQNAWDHYHGNPSPASCAAVMIAEFVHSEGIKMNNLQLSNWAAVHHIASLMQSGKVEDAQQLAVKVQSELGADVDLSSFLQLVQVQMLYLMSLDNVTNHIDVQTVRDAVLEKSPTSQGWQFLAEVYKSDGLLAAAEACYRQALSAASTNQVIILIRLTHVALTAYKASEDKDRWLGLAQEAITEALKLKPRNPVALLLQGLLHQQNANTKQAKRCFQQAMDSSFQPCDVYMRSVTRVQLMKILVHKNDQEALKALLEGATQEDDPNLHQLIAMAPQDTTTP